MRFLNDNLGFPTLQSGTAVNSMNLVVMVLTTPVCYTDKDVKDKINSVRASYTCTRPLIYQS